MAWGAGTLCSARSSRLIGAASVVAGVMLVGLVANLAVIAVGPAPGSLGATDIAWMLVAGLGNVAGLLLEYSALRRGKVGIVTPVTSTEGAIAALLAVVAGEALGVARGGLLAVVALGIVLAGAAPKSRSDQHTSAAFWLAALAALSFGISIFATGHLSASLPVGWAVLPPRLVGVAVVTIPLAVSRRLKLTRSALPLVVTAGLAEVLGFVCFAVGARDSVAVAAVLGSQFAVVASVAALLPARAVDPAAAGRCRADRGRRCGPDGGHGRLNATTTPCEGHETGALGVRRRCIHRLPATPRHASSCANHPPGVDRCRYDSIGSSLYGRL